MRGMLYLLRILTLFFTFLHLFLHLFVNFFVVDLTQSLERCRNLGSKWSEERIKKSKVAVNEVETIGVGPDYW